MRHGMEQKWETFYKNLNMKCCEKNIIEKAEKFHGHRCGGLAIGIKVCQALAEMWGINISISNPNSTLTEKIVCLAENDSCSVDAIQSILGCTIGSGTLTIKNCGKQAFNFFDRESGKSVRIYFCADVEEIPRSSRADFILSKSPGELFTFSAPNFQMPKKASISKNAVCEICKERVSESKAVIKEGLAFCRQCYEKSISEGV